MKKDETGGSNTDYTGSKANPSSVALYEFASELEIEKQHQNEIERRLQKKADLKRFDDLGYGTFNPHVRSFDDAWDRLKTKEPKIHGIDLKTKPRQLGLSVPVRSLDGGATSIVIRDKEGTYRFMKSDSDSKVVPLTHVSQVSRRNKVGETPIVRVTEGIIKADLADLYGKDMPCIGIHGVGYLPRDIVAVLRALNVGELHIAMDVEENVATDRMKMDLYGLCKDIGIRPIIETWSERYKGIDDALVAKAEIEHVDEEEIDALRRKAGTDLVYIQRLDAFANISDRDNYMLKKSQVAMSYNLSDKDMKTQVSDGRIRRVEKADVLPGEPRRIAEDTFNLWMAPREYQMDDKATVRRLQRALLRHMAYLIPNRSERRLFLKWVAHVVLNPGDRVRWAVILYSEAQQIGKTMTIEAMSHAVGPRNFNAVSNDTLRTRFNAPLSGKQLILLNEVYQRDRYEVVNRLKELITDNLIQIEQKYMPAMQVQNIASFVLTTNNDDALKIGSGDQRFVAFQCAEEQASDEHYKELAWAVHHPWCGTVVRQLAQRMNMEGFDPKRAPERTETTERFIEASRSIGEDWAYEVVQGNEWPGTKTDILSISQLKHAWREHLVPESILPKSIMDKKEHTIGKWLKAAGAVKREMRHPQTRVKKNFWILRDAERWRDEPGDRFFPATLTVVGEENDSPAHEEESWGEFKAIPLPSDDERVI